MREAGDSVTRDPRLIATACLIALTSVSLPRLASPQTSSTSTQTSADGQHDFDFELGTWVMHRRHLNRTASGSGTWIESDGDLHMVRKLWDGQACLGELKIMAPTPHFAGSLLYLYNPHAHQWGLYWANAADGSVAAPLVGRFKDGKGEFYGQDTMGGAVVFVRLIYSDITPTSFRTEQAISTDGGKTWETNSIDTYQKQGTWPNPE